MRRYLGLMLLAAAMFALPVVFSGCAARVRVYDTEHHDYHRWNRDERVYYQRWEVETHRDHRVFNRRRDDEKTEYWNWRHAHRDKNHH
ncbi:MAG TPA: hypothetical protein VE398_22855 [Acidobacteriota bacterium]|nr:hypothetical protein [Acidobacteriota bacterium]